jgi:hypothetical protein
VKTSTLLDETSLIERATKYFKKKMKKEMRDQKKKQEEYSNILELEKESKARDLESKNMDLEGIRREIASLNEYKQNPSMLSDKIFELKRLCLLENRSKTNYAEKVQEDHQKQISSMRKYLDLEMNAAAEKANRVCKISSVRKLFSPFKFLEI